MTFRNQLNRQLNFVANSCKLYDCGYLEEGLRIAVSLRVLFHDTKNSTSLLQHIGKKKSLNLLSSIGIRKTIKENAGGFQFYIPLIICHEGVKPPLNETISTKMMSFESWWDEIIFAQSQIFSRRDIVLSAANQDGGAHIDSSPNNKTIELKEGIGTLTKVVNGKQLEEELTDFHLPLLRQLGYEVLNSPELLNLK